MKRRLLDLLACPICKHYPVDLSVFEEKDEIVAGVLTCSSCGRWYPIVEEIPHMLPDELRKAKDDLDFLKKWGDKVPDDVKIKGKPFNLG